MFYRLARHTTRKLSPRLWIRYKFSEGSEFSMSKEDSDKSKPKARSPQSRRRSMIEHKVITPKNYSDLSHHHEHHEDPKEVISFKDRHPTHHHTWGYHDEGGAGPDHWADIAPAAGGQHQSPVIVYPHLATYDKTLASHPIAVQYSPASVVSIVNNGHSVMLSTKGRDSTLKGGPLGDDLYVLAQFHFHWGHISSVGSEHVIGNKAYAAELHLVHWNTTKFATFAESTEKRNGLCVLAIFLDAVATTDNPALKPLGDLLPKVSYANEILTITEGFDTAKLLPGDLTKYWTYEGSLTTPPCNESVQFIIFKEPIKVSEHQMEAFRAVKWCERDEESDDREFHLLDNYRPPQQLNGRLVKASFTDSTSPPSNISV